MLQRLIEFVAGGYGTSEQVFLGKVFVVGTRERRERTRERLSE
jgi:hypothetical protein